MNHEEADGDGAILELLAWETFEYFLKETNPNNGLVADKTKSDWPASIAAVGLALTAYPVGIERGFVSREEGALKTLTTLRFFWNSPQGEEPEATGYKGFFYHWLDMNSGRRAWDCEISTVDTALFLSGALTAGLYFDHDSEQENEIRKLANELYLRADWKWFLSSGGTLLHGWKPETGFLKYRWEGYDEALILYILALGSPTHRIPEESYRAWLSTYVWKKIYDYELIYAGPMFIHQLSHLWIDFRGIQDRYVRERGLDYFENSRRATYVQQQYAIKNPQEFELYDKHCWGITASDGPGPETLKVTGVERVFYDYIARGVPYGPDDGTLAPWAVVSSLPFAPDIVLPTIRYMIDELEVKKGFSYGFKATFNPSYPDKSENKYGWVSRYNYGLNQGPIVLMIENYRSELLWNLMKRCPYIVDGLRRAKFSGGWL